MNTPSPAHIISHRGNLHGSDPYRENHPDYIDEAIAKLDPCGYVEGIVEVDVWGSPSKGQCWESPSHLSLGHDAPCHQVSESWLRERSKRLIFHCKNIEAVDYLILARNLRGLDTEWFWHENDKMTLTNRGRLWMYPGNYHPRGTTVWLGKPLKKCSIPNMGGVCTDEPLAWRKHWYDMNGLKEGTDVNATA